VTPTIGRNSRLAATRRGVTLVEMLVTVAVLVIIMTVMVQIFQSATGALSTAQIIQDLDNQLKLLETTIRSDLGGATAQFTPPLDPENGLGYFEYIENEFADGQGEDSDDCLRFTAKAPPGQPFTGRMWVTQPANANAFYNATVQPITVTSEYAEIIYFLRNGNLYRRVLLIAPELQSAIVPSVGNLGFLPTGNGNGANFPPSGLGGVNVSWQGVNDFSAHPATTGPNTTVNAHPAAFAAQTVVLNTLGSLTNRENRFAAPRFSDDFQTITVAQGNVQYVPGADGFSDDLNSDKVPDFYPSLYPNVFNTGLVTAPNYTVSAPAAFLAFPFIFPGAYTYPQFLSADQYGWIHSPSPYANVNGQATTFEQNPLGYLQSLNHNPLDLADNLPTPAIPAGMTPQQAFQTWWGFPTWRETLSVNWNDPTKQVNDASGIGANPAAFGQPNGLTPRPTGTVPVNGDAQLLPWMSSPGTQAQGGPLPNGFDFSLIRSNPQLFSDALGYKNSTSLFMLNPNANWIYSPIDPVWAVSWEDDLVMTNVRSFDVKAYDNAFGSYADLGWADDLRLWVPYMNMQTYLLQAGTLPAPPALTATPTVTIWPPLAVGGGGVGYNTLTQTFAHEGRMPPLVNDNRLDAHYPNLTYVNPTTFTPQYANYQNYSSNIGDNNAGVVRLRRVWDSWSLEYSAAPARGLNVNTGYQTGPPFAPPIYPSYPAPYPAPLRGIQIQIRVADPTNQRIKSLTIRQDFTDKL
jgi:prepilin-type N-terminal cleavage/methylation domain-containing protein